MALLTRAEEIRLAQRIERGDLAAKDELIVRNQGLVQYFAHEKISVLWRNNQPPRCEVEDLIGYGTIGLIRAVEKFDWRKGVKFSTYAKPWIKDAIDKGVHQVGNTIHLPREILTLRSKMKGMEPDEIETLEATPAQIGHALGAPRVTVNLEQPIPNYEGLLFKDVLGDRSTDPSNAYALTERATMDAKTLRKLTPDEANVVRLRLGLVRGEMHSLKQTADKLGLPVETVRRLEVEAAARIAADEAA